MSDSTAPAHSEPSAAETGVEEWKPEPRQWTWKDLFTAPMLAFKPRCMAVAAATLLLIGLWTWILMPYRHPNIYAYPPPDSIFTKPYLHAVLEWVFLTVALIIFSLGGSFIAVFLKADLLDDEFLSFSEAFGQFRSRILPALLVPVFLMGLVAGVQLCLVYIPTLCCNLPYVGPAVYALFYPLFYLGSLFSVLIGIAVWLSVFVFPSIIAIRKHGWFDNVVDTIEAVGTKPHVLIASLALSLLLMFLAFRIGAAGITHLRVQPTIMPNGIGSPLAQTEGRAGGFCADDVLDKFDMLVLDAYDTVGLRRLGGILTTVQIGDEAPPIDIPTAPVAWYQNVTGPMTGLWQALIEALIIGYVFTLFIAGGMLSYLVVREDDYWDDEDLEDLDKLAKELEDEAKRDQAPAVDREAPTVITTPSVPDAATPGSTSSAGPAAPPAAP